MIHPFLEFGGLIFWIVFALVALVLANEVQGEKFVRTAVVLVLFIAGIVLFTDTPVWATIKSDPLVVLYGFLAWVVVGGLWAIIKWRAFFLPKLFEAYDEYRSQWLTGRALKEMPADPKVVDEFRQAARGRGVDVSYTRMVGHNKARITAWMIYWPFSLIGTFVGDFLHRVFTTIYKGIAGLLQRMSDRMASNYSELS